MLRVDPSHEFGGVRLNVCVAGVAILLSAAFFVWWQRSWKRGGGPGRRRRWRRWRCRRADSGDPPGASGVWSASDRRRSSCVCSSCSQRSWPRSPSRRRHPRWLGDGRVRAAPGRNVGRRHLEPDDLRQAARRHAASGLQPVVDVYDDRRARRRSSSRRRRPRPACTRRMSSSRAGRLARDDPQRVRRLAGHVRAGRDRPAGRGRRRLARASRRRTGCRRPRAARRGAAARRASPPTADAGERLNREPKALGRCRNGWWRTGRRPMRRSPSARAGDERAFEELVRAYQGIAFRTAYLLTGSAADAEEAAQVGFVKAWSALPRFRRGAEFRPWLLRIVANEAHNRRRSAQRREALTLRAVAAHASGGAAPSPEAAVVDDERREQLLAAVNRLDERDRDVLTCRYFLELSEQETAEVLGVRRGTVKSRTARALERLRGEVRHERARARARRARARARRSRGARPRAAVLADRLEPRSLRPAPRWCSRSPLSRSPRSWRPSPYPTLARRSSASCRSAARGSSSSTSFPPVAEPAELDLMLGERVSLARRGGGLRAPRAGRGAGWGATSASEAPSGSCTGARRPCACSSPRRRGSGSTRRSSSRSSRPRERASSARGARRPRTSSAASRTPSMLVDEIGGVSRRARASPETCSSGRRTAAPCASRAT